MKRKKLKYSDYEKQFPEYIIIVKSGCFYEAYNESTEILSREMEYRLYESYFGRITAGGPDIDKIMKTLNAEDYNYLIIEDDKIVNGHSGRNPFI